MSLQEALLELAKSNKLSIVFPSSKIPNRKVIDLPESMPLKDQLKLILKGTNLYFEIDQNQIYLFKETRIHGYIEDAKTGERLIAATVFHPAKGEYKITNDYGYFAFSTRQDSFEIEVSYVGYATKKSSFISKDLKRITIVSLEPDNSINQVVITDKLVDEDERKYIELDKGSDILLTQNQAVTALGGEPDIFQAMIRQSGVSSGTDGIGGIHVRGGKNDQNLILYDGVKLYHSAHAFGMFSVINSNIVDQTRMHKSGASGSNFGRLSSVLDVKLKDPSLLKASGNLQFTTLAGQGTFELPLIKNRLGALVSVRQTHIDPYINHISKSSDSEIFGIEETNYKFNDINLKLLGKINKNNRLFFTYYQGKDIYSDFNRVDFLDDPYDPYYDNYEVSYSWKNTLGALRWNSLLGNSTFANIQLSAYQYDYRNEYEVNLLDGPIDDPYGFSQFITYNAQTTNIEFKLGVETLSGNHHLKYGLNASQKDYQIGEFINLSEESFGSSIPEFNTEGIIPDTLQGYSNREITFYVSDKFKISNKWMIEGGVYQTFHKSKDEEIPIDGNWATYGYLKTLNKLNDQFYIGGSIGTFIQTEHLLTLGDNGYPNDIWVPSTDIIPFQRSYQVEFFAEFEKNQHKLRASTYYKKQKGLLRYQEYASLPGLSDILPELWEFEVQIGEAEGYGAEIEYTYQQTDKISLRAVYSYGLTNYNFDNINGGQSFPFDYSVPHTISLGCNLKLLPRLRLAIDWFAASGRPFTLYDSSLPYSPLEVDGNLFVEQSSNENTFTLPDVHKLSAMLSTHWSWGAAKCNLSLGVQNIYNRRNVILQYNLIDEGLKSQQGFPILPMVLFRVAF